MEKHVKRTRTSTKVTNDVKPAKVILHNDIARLAYIKSMNNTKSPDENCDDAERELKEKNLG